MCSVRVVLLGMAFEEICVALRVFYNTVFNKLFGSAHRNGVEQMKQNILHLLPEQMNPGAFSLFC